MAWQSRKPLHENSPPNAAACGNHRYARPLRFESLEDRRLLAIIADTFSDAFGQVSRLVGSEATVLTLDTAGHYKVFYRPNDELGYIDPDTGSLLNADYYSGSSTVLVLDATVTGNISDLVGVTYSNGQAIATNGGNTVYHSDGSIMRSGGVWTYDAGATLEDASGNFFWSNGNSLKNGTTFKHANGATFGNATGTMFYASGIIFKNTGIGLFYPGAQTLRDASSNYFYAAGASLESGNVIGYSNGAVMVDSTGNVYNSSGTSSFTPFTRIQTIGSNEFYTHVENGAGDTVVTIENNTGGSFGAYVAHIHLTYQTPPNPVGIAVTAPDAQSLRFTWVSGGGSTTGYRVAVANGVSPPGDPATGSDTANNYYDVTGLTAGQKVSIRVWAKDGSGLLSTGVFATGTAGQYLQVPQTQQLIASSLGNTLAQIYDSVNQNIVYTVDQAGNFLAFFYVNDEMGYVNVANGDRASSGYYSIPSTNLVAAEVVDFHPIGNLVDIPDGARYINGQLARNGSTYYHTNGAVLRNASGQWFYANGTRLADATGDYWLGGTVPVQSGGISRYPNNNILESGNSILYSNGNPFLNLGSAFYPGNVNLRTATGNLFYETGATFFSGNAFRYSTGPVMIDTTGKPYDLAGGAATVPFGYSEFLATSSVYAGIDTDRVGRYAVAIIDTSSAYLLGSTVDYAARNADFNHDNTVGAADYVLFRKTQGSTFNLTADANANGTIDQPDYDTWRAHFGQALPALGSGSGSEASPLRPGERQDEGALSDTTALNNALSITNPPYPLADSRPLPEREFVGQAVPVNSGILPTYRRSWPDRFASDPLIETPSNLQALLALLPPQAADVHGAEISIPSFRLHNTAALDGEFPALDDAFAELTSEDALILNCFEV